MVPAGMLMGTSPIVIALTGVAMGGEKLVVSSAMGVGGSGKVEPSPAFSILRICGAFTKQGQGHHTAAKRLQ